MSRSAASSARLLAMSVAFTATGVAAQLPAPAPTGTVAGTVTRRGTTEPVRAALTIAGLRTYSDADGRYSLRGVAAGRRSLVVRALGYRPDTVVLTVVPADSVRADVALVPVPFALAPVQSVARSPDRRRFEETPDAGSFTVSGPMLATLPALGETDVLRVVQMLPGVVARNDFSAGYNVRGGEADQNLILLDGVPIYNPFHLAGVYSTFIEPAVGDITLYTGGFPARYGGRLSSVLDVASRAEERPGFHGTLTASLLATSLAAGGSVEGGRTSWNVAARRTYADAVVDAVTDEYDFPYHFQDAQLFVRRAGVSDTLSVTAYAGLDELAPAGAGGEQVGLRWGNALVGARWAGRMGDARAEQRLSLSTFNAGLELGGNQYRFANDVTDVRAAGIVDLTVGERPLTAGYDVAAVSATYVLRARIREEPLFELRQRPTELATFLETTWRPGTRTMIRTSLRGEFVPLARWAGLSPRIAAKRFLRDDIALTASIGRHAQWLHALRNEDVPLRLLDFWVGSDRTAPVSLTDQIVVGAELWPTSFRFLRVEGYYKRYQRLLEWNPAEDFTVHGDEFREGRGHSYGADVILRQLEVGAAAGWLSYSYGVSHREQEGTRYFPPQDRRHSLNVVGSYRTRRYVLGAHFAYGSGLPYTSVVGQFNKWRYDPGTGAWSPPGDPAPAGGARNGTRYPPYHRLDLSVARSYRLGRAELTPFLQVVNVYNRQNVFTYLFDYASSPPQRERIQQLPVVPSVGLQVTW